MVNAFIEFVKDYRKNNPSLSYKDAMKEAAKVYKSDATTTSKKKVKIAEPNMKMEITETKLPKADRQKKVKKYKKLAKEVESDIGKSRITPKQFNEYVILANVLAGKSQKNSYARHLKMVRRKLNTKKLKPLKEKLEKATSDSNELIDLLDKQKASNIKRPLKDKSTYIREQNKMNRYRRILGEKISAFNKDPDNKGKTLPKKRLEKEAEEESTELLITDQIEGNLRQIAIGKNLKYGDAYKEYKKKNPTGTRTTFKSVYADMKKMNKTASATVSATPSRASSISSTPKRTLSISKKVVSDDDEPTAKKAKKKDDKPKLTATQLKNLKERKDEAKDSTSPEALFVSMGRPDNAKLLRYVRQLETIQRKDPDADEDLDDILEKFQNLYDEIAIVRAETKVKRTNSGKVPKPPTTPKDKTVGGKKPKSKEIITDSDEDEPAAAPAVVPKRIMKKMIKFKDRFDRDILVSSKLRTFLEKELSAQTSDADTPTGGDKLKLNYLRLYSHKQFEKKDGSIPLGSTINSVNAFIDDWERKKYSGEESNYQGIKPSDSESSDESASTMSEKARNMTARAYEILADVKKTYGQDDTELDETENQMDNPELGVMEGTSEQILLALERFLKTLDLSGKKNEIMKTIEFENDDPEIFNIQKVVSVSYHIIEEVIEKIDKDGNTSGEGFAGVEPINSESDLEDTKGGALTDLIHRKLIKNNPKVSKQDDVDTEDKPYVKFNKEVYEKPDNRKANLEGFTYVPSQSDNENAVYQNSKEKKLVIIFRGSAKLKDLKADLGVAIGRLKNTSRHDNTEELVKKMKTLYPEYSITLTGHSLGGSLAVSMSSRHNLPAVVFNAGHTIGNDHKDSDIKFYTKEGDTVSMLGANSYKNVKMIKGSHGNPIKDHSLSNFEGGDFEKKLLGLDGGSLLGSNPATYSPNPIVGGSLVGGIKSKLMDYAKENSKVKKALLLRDVYTLVKKIKNNGFKMDMVKEIGKIALDLNDLA